MLLEVFVQIQVHVSAANDIQLFLKMYMYIYKCHSTMVHARH